MHIEDLNKFENKILRGSINEYIDILNKNTISKAYYIKKIPKNNQTQRILHCIKSDNLLYKLQVQLKNNFLDYIPLSSHAYGYIKKKSYFDYLKPHRGNDLFLKLDIKDFFNNIKSSKLKDVLEYYIDDIIIKDEIKLIDFIVELVTLNGHLPQGAVTSPVLSNIFFRQLDIRIARYCIKFGIVYTRYVDDMLFSSKNYFLHKKVFINGISKIIKSEGFILNNNKIIKTKNEISLNGFVIGTEIRLSRKKTAMISSLIFCFQQSKEKTVDAFLLEVKKHYKMNSDQEIDLIRLQNYMAGYRSFLLSLLPFDSVGTLPEELTKRNNKILYKINEIEKIIDVIV